MRKIILIVFFILIASPAVLNAIEIKQGGWKAGVARTVITPKEPLSMGGYASRSHPSTGTMHDLWVKALVMQDNSGRKAVLVTSDLLGFPKGLSDRIRVQLNKKYGLSKDQILLNSSHTHSGPVLETALQDVYVLDTDQIKKIDEYTRSLEGMIVNLVGNAIKDLEPVSIYAENGVTRFQVNRRNNLANVLPQLPELQGPNDFAVPVIKVVGKNEKLKAIAFGYACHPTVLDGYEWSGDYVGFAQIELEKAHPEAVALFFQGAGADQNPLPRRTVPLAKQYGRELAAAVDRVLEEKMRELPANMITTYSEVKLPLAEHSEAEYTKMAKTSSIPYQKRWAERMLANLKKDGKLPTSYPFPIQVWSIGGQPLVSLGGELTIEYAIKIKQILGQQSFVAGYSNDVMSYIPTCTILQEGGYEGESAQMVYGLPAKWGTTIETRILNEVITLAEQAGILNKIK